MRLGELVKLALFIEGQSPDSYKRDQGRCPEGYISNDDGHCVKESRLKQKARERKNERERNFRKSRQKKKVRRPKYGHR